MQLPGDFRITLTGQGSGFDDFDPAPSSAVPESASALLSTAGAALLVLRRESASRVQEHGGTQERRRFRAQDLQAAARPGDCRAGLQQQA